MLNVFEISFDVDFVFIENCSKFIQNVQVTEEFSIKTWCVQIFGDQSC